MKTDGCRQTTAQDGPPRHCRRPRRFVLATVGTLALFAVVAISVWTDTSRSRQDGGPRPRITGIAVDASASARRLRATIDVADATAPLGATWHGVQIVAGECQVRTFSEDGGVPSSFRAHLLKVAYLENATARFTIEAVDASTEALARVLSAELKDLDVSCDTNLVVDLFRSGLTVPLSSSFRWSPLPETEDSSTARPSVTFARETWDAGRSTVAEHGVLANATYKMALTLPPGTMSDFLDGVDLRLESEICYAESSKGALEMCAKTSSAATMERDATTGGLRLSLPIQVQGHADMPALAALLLAPRGDAEQESGQQSATECTRCAVFRAKAPDSALAALMGPEHTLGVRNDAEHHGRSLTASRRLSRGRLTIDAVDFGGLHLFLDTESPYAVDISAQFRSPRTYVFDWFEKFIGFRGAFNLTSTFDRELEHASVSMDLDSTILSKKLLFGFGYWHHITEEESHVVLNTSSWRISVDTVNDGADVFGANMTLSTRRLNVTVGYMRQGSADEDEHNVVYKIQEGFTSKGLEFQSPGFDGDVEGGEEHGEERGGIGGIVEKIPFAEDVADGFGAVKSQWQQAKNRTVSLEKDVAKQAREFAPDWKDSFADSPELEGARLKVSEWLKGLKKALKERSKRLRREPSDYAASLGGTLSVTVIRQRIAKLIGEMPKTISRQDITDWKDRTLTKIRTRFDADGQCVGDDGPIFGKLCQGGSCCADSLIEIFQEKLDLGRKSLNELHEKLRSCVNFTKFDDGSGFDFSARFGVIGTRTPWGLLSYRRQVGEDSVVGTLYANATEKLVALSVHRTGTEEKQRIVATLLKRDGDRVASVEASAGHASSLTASGQNSTLTTFEVSASGAQGKAWFFTNFSMSSSPENFALFVNAGPRTNKLVRTSVTIGRPNSTSVVFGVMAAFGNFNVIKVYGSADVGSESHPMALALGAEQGINWAVSIFDFQGALTSPRSWEGIVKRSDDHFFHMNDKIKGNILFKLYGTKFLNIDVGLEESRAHKEHLLYTIIRQGPFDMKLGSGTLELDHSKEGKMGFNFRVDNGWRVRLFRLFGTFDKEKRGADGKILYGLMRLPVSGEWSDGFVPDASTPGVSSFSLDLRTQVGVYNGEVSCVLEGSDEKRISLADLDIDVTERQLVWKDFRAPGPETPTLSDGSLSTTTVEAWVKLSDVAFSAEDITRSVAAAAGLDEAMVSVEFDNITVLVSYDVTVPVVIDQAKWAIADDFDLPNTSINVALHNSSDAGADQPLLNASWVRLNVVATVPNPSEASRVALSAQDADHFDVELWSFEPMLPEPEVHIVSPPRAAFFLRVTLAARSNMTPPAPSAERLRSELAAALSTDVQLEVTSTTSVPGSCGSACAAKDLKGPHEEELNAAPRAFASVALLVALLALWCY